MAEPQADVLITGLVLLYGGIHFLRKGFKLRRQRRLMEDTPTSTARAVSLGPVEVKGTARATNQGTFPSPVTGTDCLAAKYTVERWDRGDRVWYELADGIEGDPFYVEDDTGRILVDPTDATMDISDANTEQTKVSPDGTTPTPIEWFLERSKVSEESSTFDLGVTSVGDGRKRRYTEEIITPDEEVFVFGTASENSSSADADGLIIKDGERDMFFISDKRENALTSNRRWSLFWRVIVGALLTTAAVLVLLTQVIAVL